MPSLTITSPCLVFAFWVALSASAADGLHLAAVLQDETALTGAHDIEIVDGLAYVAGKGFTQRNRPKDGVFPYESGKGGSLAVVEVKQPVSPRILWHSRTPLAYEDAETVMPLGPGRLLVGTRDVFLFDVSRPAPPRGDGPAHFIGGCVQLRLTADVGPKRSGNVLIESFAVDHRLGRSAIPIKSWFTPTRRTGCCRMRYGLGRR